MSARVTVIDSLGRARHLVLDQSDVVAHTMAAPQRPVLRQNYPNPFNPETWIPYELSQTATVQISIYDSMGRLVRTLDIGAQTPGVYTDRGAAAYWDGRNETGERVASGVYFYALQAGSYYETRRLVINK